MVLQHEYDRIYAQGFVSTYTGNVETKHNLQFKGTNTPLTRTTISFQRGCRDYCHIVSLQSPNSLIFINSKQNRKINLSTLRLYTCICRGLSKNLTVVGDNTDGDVQHWGSLNVDGWEITSYWETTKLVQYRCLYGDHTASEIGWWLGEDLEIMWNRVLVVQAVGWRDWWNNKKMFVRIVSSPRRDSNREFANTNLQPYI
jgi:hypothetical protein